MNKLTRHFPKKTRKAVVFLFLLVLISLAIIALCYFPQRRRRVKVIGYACDYECGGWADRQKGMVGAFVLAAMLGKQFKIHMVRPCSLDNYLMPARGVLDWRLAPEELATADVTWIRHVDSDCVRYFTDLVKQDDLEGTFGSEHTLLVINMEIVHILRQHRLAQGIHWLQEQTIPEIYHMVLTQLFALMPGTQTLQDNFQRSLPAHAKLICAQIRVGGKGDTESFNTIGHLAGLAAFFAPYNTTSSSPSSSGQFRFLFTSDKAYMLQHVRHLFPALFVSLSGPVTHVDRSTGNGVCGGLGRVIVEQLVLSTCHVLVISESGMGKIAAFLRNTDDNLFLFHNGLVEKTRRDLPFPNRPSW